MAVDAPLKMQYHSGSGTNRLVFRGRICDGVAGGFITDVGGTFSMATDGSSALMVTEQQLQHVMAIMVVAHLKVDQMVQLQYSVLLLRRQVLMLIH